MRQPVITTEATTFIVSYFSSSLSASRLSSTSSTFARSLAVSGRRCRYRYRTVGRGSSRRDGRLLQIEAISTTGGTSSSGDSGDNGEGNRDGGSGTFQQSEAERRQSRSSSAQLLWEQLQTAEFDNNGGGDGDDKKIYRGVIDAFDNQPKTEIGQRIYESRSVADFFFNYLSKGFNEDFDRYLSVPSRLLPVSAIFILFGFFAATSATTIIGSVADWDPLAAAVLLILTEGFTKFYYTKDNVRSSRLLQLINAFKIGLIYGMIVDSFKLCT